MLQNFQVIEHPLNAYLESCYQNIFLKPHSDELSDSFVRSSVADKALNTFYYAQPQEVCARAFEAFIQDQPLKNALLVQGTKLSGEAKLGVYPRGEERPLLDQSFKDYFSRLGYAVDKQSLVK